MSLPFALIIEDNPDQALVFSKALEVAGYITEIIYDGAVAQKRLQALRAEGTPPSVIVLDLHIPNIPGKKLLEEIRADEQLKKTRVLLATADAALAERLFDQADFILLKPISFAQLSLLAERIRPKNLEGSPSRLDE